MVNSKPPGSPDGPSLSFPRPGSSSLLNQEESGPSEDLFPVIRAKSVFDSPRQTSPTWIDDDAVANPSLMLVDEAFESRDPPSRAPLPHAMQDPMPAFSEVPVETYETEMAQKQATNNVTYSFSEEFPTQHSATDRAKRKKKKSSERPIRQQTAPEDITQEKRRSASASRANSRTHLELRDKRKELSIEERLDVQLQQIMKSKSKLAIAMERVSADMHIKKREREIVKLKKDLAEHLHTVHTQRDEIIRLNEESKERNAKLEQIKKRNDRLLHKQRTFDEMKRMVEEKQPAETPEEMAMRVKKDVMSRVERTIQELKYQKSELGKEVKAEQAINHKANLVIAELERELRELKGVCTAAEDQVRYVMAQDEKNVQRLHELEDQLKLMDTEQANLEATIRTEVEQRMAAQEMNTQHESTLLKLRTENANKDDSIKELATQVAELETKVNNSDGLLFDQSKKHAMAAEKVVSLQKEVEALNAALKHKMESEEEAAILAKDAVVNKLQEDLRDTRLAKEEIEVALGRLVAQGEIERADWQSETQTMQEELEKALKKVEQMPGLKGQLTEALTIKERLAMDLAELTGQHRILQEGKADADAAVASQSEQSKKIEEQAQQLLQLQRAADEAACKETELLAQIEELQSAKGTLEHTAGAEASEKEELIQQLQSKDQTITQMRDELTQLLTEKELSESEMKGVRHQCQDLQSKLVKEREDTARERALAERDRELASAAQAEASRLESEKQEVIEELEAMKVQTRSLMAARRPSTFTADDLEKCRAIFNHIRADETKEAEELLSTGMPIDLTDSAGFTPLMVACQHGMRRIVKACLRRGASVTKQNQHGNTALHCCMPDHEDLAQYLISKGNTDENITNHDGKKWNEL